MRLPVGESSSYRVWARRGAVLLVGVGAIGVACAPSRIAQPPGATQLRISASEFKFQASTPRVAIGQPVTITFENRGAIEHHVHLVATGTHLSAAPGQTVSATVVFPTAGDFDFVCIIPGHQEAGMTGKVQAGNPPAAASRSSSLEVAGASATPAVAAPLPPLPVGTTRVPQGQVAPPLDRRAPALVSVDLVIKEVVGTLADGVGFKYWTFGGTRTGTDGARAAG
jgi:plastocyanin